MNSNSYLNKHSGNPICGEMPKIVGRGSEPNVKRKFPFSSSVLKLALFFAWLPYLKYMII